MKKPRHGRYSPNGCTICLSWRSPGPADRIPHDDGVRRGRVLRRPVGPRQHGADQNRRADRLRGDRRSARPRRRWSAGRCPRSSPARSRTAAAAPGPRARPRRAGSVSRTWLSSTARRWLLKSRPSRGTLPWTAATVTVGSLPAPARRGPAGAASAVVSSTAVMHSPGTSTAGADGALDALVRTAVRHQRAISTTSAHNDVAQQSDRERQQRHAAELASGRNGPLV